VGSIPSFKLRVVNKLPPEMDISLLPGNSLLFSRFLPFNIMHVIHDDLLGVYFTLVEYFPSDDMEKEAYDLSTRLVLADEHSAGAYVEILQYLSNSPVLHHSELPYHLLTCYEVSILLLLLFLLHSN